MSFDENYFKNRKFEDKYYYLATQIIEYLQPTLVLDYGCGEGFLTHSIIYNNVECYGYDISEYAINNAYGLAEGNTFTHIVNKDYDLVICMDVLEHIPKNKEQKIIDDICKWSNKYILLSVCDTMLSKTYIDPTHINIRPRSYWAVSYTHLTLPTN